MCCSHQGAGFKIGQNVSRVLANDRCNLVTMQCAAGGNGPQIEIDVENKCHNTASQEALEMYANATEERLNALQATLDIVLNNTGKTARPTEPQSSDSLYCRACQPLCPIANI